MGSQLDLDDVVIGSQSKLALTELLFLRNRLHTLQEQIANLEGAVQTVLDNWAHASNEELQAMMTNLTKVKNGEANEQDRYHPS
jgi:aconitase B